MTRQQLSGIVKRRSLSITAHDREIHDTRRPTVIEVVPGHTYKLQNLKGAGTTTLRFYMDPVLHSGKSQEGPSTQEVLRACIARVKALDAEQPAVENADIIEHLRAAIRGFELRALRVKMERDPEGVEALAVSSQGHIFELVEDAND